MPFTTQCPFCSTTALAPDGVEGAIARCRRCGSAYSVAALDESLKLVAATVPLADAPTAPARDFDPPPVAESAPAQIRTAGRKKWLHKWGVISVFCAAEGLLLASIPPLDVLFMPLCLTGVVLATVGGFVSRPRNKIQAVWLFGGAVVSVLPLLIAVLPWFSPTGVDINGKVFLDDELLTAGTVTVFGRDGQVRQGTIRADGGYTIKNIVPGGPLKFGVVSPIAKNNQAAVRKIDPKTTTPVENKRDSSTWSRIPEKYADPQKAGLAYEAKPGRNTWDIRLKADAHATTPKQP